MRGTAVRGGQAASLECLQALGPITVAETAAEPTSENGVLADLQRHVPVGTGRSRQSLSGPEDLVLVLEWTATLLRQHWLLRRLAPPLHPSHQILQRPALSGDIAEQTAQQLHDRHRQAVAANQRPIGTICDLALEDLLVAHALAELAAG